MSRLSIGGIVFILIVGVGLAAFCLFAIPSQPTSQLGLDVATISTTPPNDTVSAIATPSPEFTNVDVDEDGSGAQLAVSLAFKGKSAICRSEKSSFANRSAIVFFKRGEKFALERRPLTLGALRKTGTSEFFPVDFKNSPDVLFLLSDNGALRPGPVQTLYIQPWSSDVPDNKLFFDGLRIGDSRSYRLGNTNYTVRVSTGPSSAAGPVAVLVLETPEQKQMIWFGTIFEKKNEVGELEWVGDLDGDERLDLMFKYFEPNGGGSVHVLLLSSHAKQGNLIGPAAFSFARDCR
jgi:hypothetical protein